MFDLPDAKRVRRDDLYNSDDGNEGTASPIDDTRARHLQDQLAQLYGPITVPSQDPVAPSETEPSIDAPPGEAEDEAFEFRLFAPTTTAVASDINPSSATDVAPTQRIILSNSDDEDLGDGAFTIPHRRLSWYIAAPATGRRKAEFEEAAVSTETVRRGRDQRAWALEKPWRVTVIRTGSAPVSQSALAAKPIGVKAAEGDGKTKRTKPNKKQRIVVRIRERALSEKLEAERLRCAREQEEKASRGAEDAEKRTARNRERKIKRREREKRKKAAAAAGMPEPSGEAESGSGSDGD
ncbi:hypothetical protein V500_07410 [Pseudogymnoascus sp. VKM F-4518 (FW-2643)]|nr:hypothetical protein V500_07410 [Pseudogymnoascus sp. VKM F-4518 (FW-2643)]